jgi:hypothetical protein
MNLIGWLRTNEIIDTVSHIMKLCSKLFLWFWGYQYVKLCSNHCNGKNLNLLPLLCQLTLYLEYHVYNIFGRRNKTLSAKTNEVFNYRRGYLLTTSFASLFLQQSLYYLILQAKYNHTTNSCCWFNRAYFLNTVTYSFGKRKLLYITGSEIKVCIDTWFNSSANHFLYLVLTSCS